jgi:hypothetical protein
MWEISHERMQKTSFREDDLLRLMLEFLGSNPLNSCERANVAMPLWLIEGAEYHKLVCSLRRHGFGPI